MSDDEGLADRLADEVIKGLSGGAIPSICDCCLEANYVRAAVIESVRKACDAMVVEDKGECTEPHQEFHCGMKAGWNDCRKAQLRIHDKIMDDN